MDEHLPIGMKTVAEAIAVLDEAEIAPRIERLPLDDAVGRRLAEDLFADRDDPAFDKAVMDGFAIRAADIPTPGRKLKLIETIAAGSAGMRVVGPGEASAIMTGAPVPPGADAVVQVERTRREGDSVIVDAMVRPGQSISPRGSDCRVNQAVLNIGDLLGAAQIAVAASIGAANVSVFDKPVVTILATGNEIISINQKPSGSQIRNSNAHMLNALLRQLGCEIRHVEIVPDDWNAVKEAIQKNATGDALFITGGMSMGEFDYVPKALIQLGAKLQITKVRIKPGKPFVYATIGNCHIFGLPGNPVSALVCAHRFAGRMLRRMAGGRPHLPLAEVRITADLPANGDREFYQPGILMGSEIQPLSWKGSADIYTLAHANALLIRPENQPALNAGMVVNAMSL